MVFATDDRSSTVLLDIVQVNTFTSWLHLANKDALIHLAPAVAATAVLLVTMKYARHPLALPAVLLAIPGIFHITLLAMGMSLQEAADASWVAQPEVLPVLKCILIPILFISTKSSNIVIETISLLEVKS